MSNGVHDSIWRSCERAAERLHNERKRQEIEVTLIHESENGFDPDSDDTSVEDLLQDAVDIATQLGVKRAVCERLVVLAYNENPNYQAVDLASWICRNERKR